MTPNVRKLTLIIFTTMSQKVQKYRSTNEQSKNFGKYFVRPVYDDRFVTTDELADFIQSQCTVKRSDCKAVLDELGSAFKHYFELGQKIKLDNIGIFKIGLSSSPSDTEEGCTAANVKKSRVLFQPETTSIANGEVVEYQRPMKVNGQAMLVTVSQPCYDHPAVMLKDVRFELTKSRLGSGIEAASGGSDGSSSSGESGSGDTGDRP